MSEVLGAPRTRTLPKAETRGAVNLRQPLIGCRIPRLASGVNTLLQPYIFVIDGIVIDATIGWRDPCRHLAGLRDALHQAQDVRPVAFARQPVARVRSELFRGNRLALGSRRHGRPVSDVAPKTRAGQREAEAVSGFLDQPV